MRKYYFYLGYADGSGKPYGYVVKYYTDEEYEYWSKRCGHNLKEIPLLKKDGEKNAQTTK